MKAAKPHFVLTRIDSAGDESAPIIVPVTAHPAEAIVDRRDFLGSGLSAAAILLLLNACAGHNDEPQPQEPTRVTAPDSSLLAHQRGGGIILAISDDGNLNSIGDDGVLKTWSLRSGQLMSTGHGRVISSANCREATTLDGKLRVTLGGFGRNIEVRSLPDNRLIATLAGHRNSITCLVITPDGKELVSADYNGTIIIWDLDPPRFHSFLFDPKDNSPDVKGASYTAYDRTSGQYISYTLPCGSPVPLGATCVCNCVPGSYGQDSTPPPAVVHHPHRRHLRHYGGYSSDPYCSCNKVCTCVPVYR